jgi:GT2 family glycosyltransferase
MTAIDRPSPDNGRASREGPVQHVDCVVVSVTYNSADHVATFLDSIPQAANGLSFRCLVVDNASADGTVSLLRQREDVLLVESRENLGYSGAINVARAAAGPCSSLLVANPDLVLEPNAIRVLYAAICEPGVGVAVPMLLEDDGSLYLSLRREPSVLRSLGDALFGARLHSRPAWLSETVRDRHAYLRSCDVDWASGAMMLMSRDCVATVGEWDARTFFLYAEETDFAARARRGGYRIRYVPAARARHERGGSGQSPALGALLAVNRVRYYEKYHPTATAELYRATIALQLLLRCFRATDRAALRAVCRRSRWHELPGGRRTPAAP